MKIMLVILLSCLLCISCSKKEKSNQIIISGKSLTENIDEIKLRLNEYPVPLESLEYFIEVKDDSSFSTTISSDKMLQGTIRVGGFWHKINLMPGDNLKLIIDGDSIAYSGEGSNKNVFLLGIEKKGLISFSSLYMKAAPISETLKEADRIVNESKEYLNEFDKSEKLEEEFKSFFTESLNADYESIIRNYKEFYSFRNHISNDSLSYPPELNYVDSYQCFNKYANIPSRSFFYEISNFIYSKAYLAKVHNKIDIKQYYETAFFDSLKGNVKAYSIAHWLASKMGRNEIDTVVYDRFKAEIKNPIAQGFVDKSYNRMLERQKMLNESLNEEFKQTLLEDDKGNQLTFGEMIKKYEGKLIYVDNWSLGCGPCRSNMPKSKKIKENLKNQPIEFVYITQDPKSDDLWKEVYEVSLTEKNHYRFVNGIDAKLLKYTGVNWVPNYMLIDKNGNLLNYLAVRPDNPSCEEELRNLL